MRVLSPILAPSRKRASFPRSSPVRDALEPALLPSRLPAGSIGSEAFDPPAKLAKMLRFEFCDIDWVRGELKPEEGGDMSDCEALGSILRLVRIEVSARFAAVEVRARKMSRSVFWSVRRTPWSMSVPAY